jgi:hypothetical protein
MEQERVHELERRAAQALVDAPDYLWDGRSLPIPVEDIVDSHFGLQVRETEEMTAAPGCPPLGPGQTISGLLLTSRREIWVNAEEARRWPARRRFTLGHELGHWVLHGDRQSSLFCRHGSVDPDEAGKSERKRPPLPETEQEANQFAAALLMPRPLLESRYRALAGDPECFPQLCAIFGVSGAAMSRRLRQVIPPGGPRPRS